MPQPNILLIQSDQHRADCLGVNGHPLIQTPHLDRLAREGCTFSHAFTPAPICTPSRVSLLTGLWPTQHGSITNQDAEAGKPLDPTLATYTQALDQAGYFLAHIGKWGIDTKLTPLDFGVDVYVDEKGYETWRKEQGIPPKPKTNRWFGETDPYITSEQSSLAWGADRTIEQLQQAAQEDRPFCIRWDTREPHLPNVVPEPYASLYLPDTIPPWPNFPDPMQGKPYIQRQQKVTWGIEDWTWEEWAPVVGRYLGEISLLDAQIGRILDELQRLGIENNTLVIYTCDHGDLCGAHGLIDKHYAMYDELVRVPLILRWPDQIAAGQTCDAFVSSAIDLASTLCDAAGVESPKNFMGQSLLHPSLTLPSLGREPSRDKLTRNSRPQGAPAAIRNSIFSTYFGNQFGLYSQRMVRDRRWKYIWNPTDVDELYDLERDPAELVNRISDTTCAEELRRLRHELVHWMESTSDSLLNGWTKQQLLEGRKL
ncbi:MAG: sulfatase-like hydrolase/transferase [Caldilineaceae bacterium]